jgi:hypothetical protein
VRSYFKKPFTKRAGGVVQGEGPEFKPLYLIIIITIRKIRTLIFYFANFTSFVIMTFR